MDAYDENLAPCSFGLTNTGSICFLNSLLQNLVGCTAFIRTVMSNREYMMLTQTGTTMYNFVSDFTTAVDGKLVSRDTIPVNISSHSGKILTSLTDDLKKYRPNVIFGRGQESASEFFIHLLDMMEPIPVVPNNVLTRLFLHRFRCRMHCISCKKEVSSMLDHSVNFDMFHIDNLKNQPTNIEDFSRSITLQMSEVSDYKCPSCVCSCNTIPCSCNIKYKAIRIHQLTMAPEILLLSFNQYTTHKKRYFPETLEFPGIDNKVLIYILVGQVEHAGTIRSGHYWARGLRKNRKIYTLNDSGVGEGVFGPTLNTYIITYHYAGIKN